MYSRATLLLLAALPALAGVAGGEVVSAGARPSFAPSQRTTVVAPLGLSATLDCAVLGLFDKSVSWVRSRDLHILSHAGVVFTADARVSATAGATHHTLRIERLRDDDTGRYECQVNTEPKMSLFFNLTVVDEPVPRVVVSALGAGAARAAAGGAAALACEARYEPPPRSLPLPPLDVRWRRYDKPLDLQSSRGGVSLDTERWPDRALSRLTLAELTANDEGEYLCTAAGQAAVLYLHVLSQDDDLNAEAMQRDEGSHNAAHTHTLARTHTCTLALAAALLAARAR